MLLFNDPITQYQARRLVHVSVRIIQKVHLGLLTILPPELLPLNCSPLNCSPLNCSPLNCVRMYNISDMNVSEFKSY